MQCSDFREIADSYLSDELMVETNHEVLRHLESCTSCRNELSARRELRNRMREAVKNDRQFEMRKTFAIELITKLKETPTKQNQNVFAMRKPTTWLAIAASLILFALIVSVALRQKNDSQTSVVTLAAMTQFAIGDHKNCAIQHNLKENPISLSEAAKRYDKVYAELDKAVMNSVSASDPDIKMLGAHHCVFEGKTFAHVVMRYQGKVVSVLVTPRKTKEIVGNTETITCSSKDGFQTSCFETERFSVFVISDLSEQENLSIARQVQKSVSKHIA